MGINLIKIRKCLISVKVYRETLYTNRKISNNIINNNNNNNNDNSNSNNKTTSIITTMKTIMIQKVIKVILSKMMIVVWVLDGCLLKVGRSPQIRKGSIKQQRLNNFLISQHWYFQRVQSIPNIKRNRQILSDPFQ